MDFTYYRENSIHRKTHLNPRSLFDIASIKLNKSLCHNIIGKSGNHLLVLNDNDLLYLRDYCRDIALMCHERHKRICKNMKHLLFKLIELCAISRDQSGLIKKYSEDIFPFIWSGIGAHIAIKSYDNVLFALQKKKLNIGLNRSNFIKILKRSSGSSTELKNNYRFILTLQEMAVCEITPNNLFKMECLVETTGSRVKLFRKKCLNIARNIENRSLIYFVRYLDLLNYTFKMDNRYVERILKKYGANHVLNTKFIIAQLKYLKKKEVSITNVLPSDLTSYVILASQTFGFCFRSIVYQQNLSKCSRTNY